MASPVTLLNGGQPREPICIRIGDITVAVSSADPKMRIELQEETRRFEVPQTIPDTTVRASWDDLSERRSGRMLFDSGGAWQLYGEDGSYAFHFSSPLLGAAPYKVARFDTRFRWGEVCFHGPYFSPEQAVHPLEYPLDELLILNLLSQGKGVELHACGLADANGDGYLFAGQSGDGKTTMARLWESEPGVTILSDDRIILRRRHGEFWMHGTPWHGEAELASAARAPLKAIFFLRRGDRNALTAKVHAEAAALLFSRSFPLFYSSAGLEFTLEFYDRLTRAVPCYELRVVPNRQVIEFIRKELGDTDSHRFPRVRAHVDPC